MNKVITEFKKWYQVSLPSQENAGGAVADHLLSGNWTYRGTIIRCGQLLGASLFAGALYLLNFWSGDGVRLLVALSATSALVYIGLAMQSRTGVLALLNLLAAPIIFATAYAGMNVVTEWLIVSYILHGCVTAVQISSIDRGLSGWLFSWSVFNSAMALLLLLG